jgi:hypothetical protein
MKAYIWVENGYGYFVQPDLSMRVKFKVYNIMLRIVEVTRFKYGLVTANVENFGLGIIEEYFDIPEYLRDIDAYNKKEFSKIKEVELSEKARELFYGA